MNRQRLAPWCRLRWQGQEVAFFRTRGGEDLFALPVVPVSLELMALLKAQLPLLDWPQWYQRSQTMQEALEIKALRNYLEAHELCLEEVAENIWSRPKSFLPQLPTASVWAGFSRFVAIVADPDAGFWLEVPGATSSLWAEDAAGLAALLSAVPTQPLQHYLRDHGFDGRALLPALQKSSTLQDWLWWESTRFLDRLGPLSHVVPQKIPELVLPQGTKVTGPSVNATRPARQSVREHEQRRPVTQHELLTLFTQVFGNTESKYSPWHGMVHRNHGASGGGAWEESGWLWVNTAQGLPAGLYQFNGQEKSFVSFSLDSARREFWTEQSKKAWGRPAAPQVVVAIVADFSKLPRKYYRLSQQLAHLNTGLRTAELLTAADQLGLASCALGGGIMRDLALQFDLSPLLFAPVCEIAIGGQAQ